MKYIYIFIGIIILKFLINLINYINNFRYERIWSTFFTEANVNSKTYAKQIQNHFKNANIKDSNRAITIPTGYGQLATQKFTSFNNIFLNDVDNMALIQNAFLESRGVYKKRMIDSFNPFYWIDLIIKLPKHFIEYLGLDTETIFTKIFQIIYWLIDSVLLVYYRENIFNFFQNFISELFK